MFGLCSHHTLFNNYVMVLNDNQMREQKGKKAKYEETNNTIKRQKATRTKDYESVFLM